MKGNRIHIILVVLALLVVMPLSAQTESMEKEPSQEMFASQKDFGGFILDMGSMLNASSLVVPPLQLNHIPVSYEFDIQQLMNSTPPENLTFQPSVIFDRDFKPSSYSMYGRHYLIGNGPLQWQGATYKLNNGMRITTYGEYDADGNKVYNPHRLPWEKNRFNAAFEMKTENGKFGIRLEVHGGRNYPY